ncbi:MAG: protein kinase [Prevotella sp.]|nr:protein kinase [Prevotella sp.]
MCARRIELSSGDIIGGKYRIVKDIGSGTYGDVFLVKDIYDSFYALKVLRLSHSDFSFHKEMVARFEREYETAKMPGRYLVHSLEYGEIKGNPFFSMEYCANGDVASYLGSNTALLPQLAYNILAGLHDLHTSGIIHRDLKSANVLVRADGTAALTDFGTIGYKDPKKQGTKKNIFGQLKQQFGSPLYMAPEMHDRKGGGVTYLPTIDIFSLGVMLYELLSGGKFPFGNPQEHPEMDEKQLEAYSKEFLDEYIENIKDGRWDKNSISNIANADVWLNIIGECLKSDYRDRYQSAIDVLEDLKPLLNTPVEDITPDIRSEKVTRIIITQGGDVGVGYNLNKLLENRGRMIMVGRSMKNDIVLNDSSIQESVTSRWHFTLERSKNGAFWLIKDGQWRPEERSWVPSTNGTYLNARAVGTEGERVYTGDIITAGEFKMKLK